MNTNMSERPNHNSFRDSQYTELKRSLHFQHSLCYMTERPSRALHLDNKSKKGWGGWSLMQPLGEEIVAVR